MENQYICPKCSSYLKIKDNIILTVRKNEKQKGLVLLSPEIGNYDAFFHKESLGIEKGDKVDMFCPVCSDDLGVEESYKNLACIIMIDENGKKSDVYFSKILGEEATFKISEGKVDRFGDDASNYNYWGYSL